MAKSIKTVKPTLLPPASDLCQECGYDHDPREPHNVGSLYYQTKFNLAHGRAANWEDALAHCPERIREPWEQMLKDEYGFGCPECGGWKKSREDYICAKCREALDKPVERS